MDLKQVRADCRARLAGIEIPDPFDARTLSQNLARHRGRRLELVPLTGKLAVGRPCGTWIETEAADYIGYDPNTTPAHQNHIITHELAHVMWDHEGVPDLPMESSLNSAVGSATILRMLGRTIYDDTQELYAEVMASMLTAPGPEAPDVHGRVLKRLHANLIEPSQRRRRW